MPDALVSSIQHWKKRVVVAIDACMTSRAGFDVSALAAALSPVTKWEGCPRADDVLGDDGTLLYRRIPLTDHAAQGYEALLIAWPPGHATPIHDHDGLWGIELVLDGALEVEAFDLSFQETPRLISRSSSILGIGDHAAFSSADYAHRCRNLSLRQSTFSLHVYGGALNTYRSFHEGIDRTWISASHDTVREPALT